MATTPRYEFVVYLSSTLADLEAERDVALKAISEFGVVRHSFRASESGVVSTCVGDVHTCQLYVGILGQRYGYVPPAHENPAQKSITELEYEACQAPQHPAIPRLMFIKPPEAGIAGQFIDALSHKETADRMQDFLTRTRQEQTAFEFRTLDELGAELRVRVKEQADRFHKENAASGKTLLTGSATWKRQLAPIGMHCVPGTDEAQRYAIQESGDGRFCPFELSPDDDHYLATLDATSQHVQLACLLVTAASLHRLNTPETLSKVSAALRMLKIRTGRALLVCEGITAAMLPAEWQVATVIDIPADSLRHNTAATLDLLYCRARVAQPALTLDARLALPYMVLAPTREEAESLADASGRGFTNFLNPTARDLRKAEFLRIAQAARSADPAWPGSVYSGERRHWRCFGAGSITAEELVLRTVARINEAGPGSRERRFLRNARLIPRRYDLDEFLHDEFGSRKAVEAVRDSGCLIVVDEVSLLHPRLRIAADTLLVGPRTAIVALSPCDPGHTATVALLEDLSYLRVGSVVSRFKTDHDPRCEIAVNSMDRVERWLQITIPEFISSIEELESDPNLVARASALLG